MTTLLRLALLSLPFVEVLRCVFRESPPEPGVFPIRGSECGATSELVPAGSMWSMCFVVSVLCRWAGAGQGELFSYDSSPLTILQVPAEISGR